MENQKVRYGRVFFISFIISAIICGSYLYYIGYIGSQCNYSSANLNSQEAQAQNNLFVGFIGEHVSATEVKQLLSLIRSNNRTAITGVEDKTIFVNGKKTTNIDVKNGNYYKVEVANDYSVSPSTEIDLEDGADIPDEQKAGYYDNGFIRHMLITPVENIESNTSNGIVNSTVSNQSSYNNTIYSNSLNDVN